MPQYHEMETERLAWFAVGHYAPAEDLLKPVAERLQDVEAERAALFELLRDCKKQVVSIMDDLEERKANGKHSFCRQGLAQRLQDLANEIDSHIDGP